MMHGHDALQPFGEFAAAMNTVIFGLIITLILFLMGLLPIPVGYERGKVEWVMWCGTGMHAHTVYRTSDHGFQTLHPADRSVAESNGGDSA